MIDKNDGIPLYLQIKEAIKKQIASRALRPGMRLPTERELAEELAVSRNTVSMAFDELKQEGFLEIEQGRGTFVAENREENPLIQELTASNKEKALRLINLAIDECLDLGFSFEQILAFMTVGIREKESSLTNVRLLFTDCNREQLYNVCQQFRELAHLDMIPLILSDFLSSHPETQTRVVQLVKNVDLVITTTTHGQEVAERLAELEINKEIVPVAVQPRMDSLIRLARLAGTKRVGLVCLSPEFCVIMKRTLTKLGVSDVDFDYTCTENPERLAEFIEAHDVLLAFAGRQKEVQKMAGEKEVIPYVHELDLGSATIVRRAVERILQRKRKDDAR